MVRKRFKGPFAVGAHDIVHRAGEMREVTLEIPAPEKWGEGLVSVEKGEPLVIQARLESVHEGILVTAEIDTTYTGVCGRCLTDISQPLKVEFQELFGYPGTEATDFDVQDDHVDLESLVRDSIVLSLPFQPVCQPDCAGLDPDTGSKLTVGTTPEAPVDPRWASLKAYHPDHDDAAHSRVAENTEKS